MLETVRCAGPEDKSASFQAFDPRQQTWVVSDLQSKWHLQKELLKKHGVLSDSSILRATELWRRIAFRINPSQHLLSRELAQILFWDWIEPLDLPWARTPQVVTAVMNQMQAWMPAFSDPNHEQIMQEWFEANPDSVFRWGHWYKLCEHIWERCQEENLMMESWLPAMILNQSDGRLTWDSPLIFDLGPQISPVEGQLITELAKTAEVKVLAPQVPWIHLMPAALKPYEDLLGESQKGDTSWQPEVENEIQFGRFSTQLAEVKDAVARARLWLDAGVAPGKIAFIAPDIEEYWPALRLYLREEGIPVNKPLTARLGSFLEMAQWLASVRTACLKVSAADLEVQFYSLRDRPRLSFDQFRVLFSNVYDALDLNRAKALFESTEAPSKEPQTLADFLAWALREWDGSRDPQRLSALLQILGREVPRGMRLKPGQWLGYIEGLASRRELNLQPGNEAGLWCVSLSSANWLDVTHAVFLNLSEGALRSIDNPPVSPGESRRVFNDTGFAVGTADRQELEFESLWLLQRPWSELRLNFAGTDFQGGVMTPSRLWMWAGFTNGKLKERSESPLKSRWDEIQRLPLEELKSLRQMPEEQAAGLDTGLKRDVSTAVSTWKPLSEVRLSASAIESYLECPFIYAASRQLKLSDDPLLDLDVDRRTRGQLLHAVAEDLLNEPLNWERPDVEVHALVDTIRDRLQIQLGDERLWPAVRSQHVRLAKLFLAFEKQWRERFPATTTAGREVEFKAFWDVHSGSPSAGEAPVTFTGRLDRVDRDSRGRYALIDYKASSVGQRNWSSWSKNRELQLAIYSIFLEAGLTGLPAGDVVAANYYVIRESDRRKGFHLRDGEQELFDSAEKFRNFISTPDKDGLFTEVRAMIQSTVQQIMAGRLNPNPVNETLCDDCSWRTVCRAPHLN